jgi:hypothetical protein
MIEYWACVGLACFNSDFYEKVIKEDDPRAAGAAIDAWGIRLSRFEFAELRRSLKDPALLQCIQRFHKNKPMIAFRCPTPPKPCPYRLDEKGLDEWFGEFKIFYLKEKY